MKAVGVFITFAVGLLLGMTWVDTPVKFMFVVGLFALLVSVWVSIETPAQRDRRIREYRDRRLAQQQREVHLDPKSVDRYDVFSDR